MHDFKAVEEIESEFENIVVSFEIAVQLQDIGLTKRSIFGFYRHSNEKVIVRKVDGAKDFLCNAYLFEEISKFIPAHIEVNENTFLARIGGYDKLTKEEFESGHLDAEVTYQRTFVKDTPYMSICRCKGRMVAFSITQDNKYNNLICWGTNQADTAGQMFVKLYREGKIEVLK